MMTLPGSRACTNPLTLTYMPGLENGLLSFGVVVLGPGRLLDTFASESLAADPGSANA
jgi:hypothetical protein